MSTKPHICYFKTPTKEQYQDSDIAYSYYYAIFPEDNFYFINLITKYDLLNSEYSNGYISSFLLCLLEGEGTFYIPINTSKFIYHTTLILPVDWNSVNFKHSFLLNLDQDITTVSPYDTPPLFSDTYTSITIEREDNSWFVYSGSASRLDITNKIPTLVPITDGGGNRDVSSFDYCKLVLDLFVDFETYTLTANGEEVASVTTTQLLHTPGKQLGYDMNPDISNYDDYFPEGGYGVTNSWVEACEQDLDTSLPTPTTTPVSSPTPTIPDITVPTAGSFEYRVELQGRRYEDGALFQNTDKSTLDIPNRYNSLNINFFITNVDHLDGYLYFSAKEMENELIIGSTSLRLIKIADPKIYGSRQAQYSVSDSLSNGTFSEGIRTFTLPLYLYLPTEDRYVKISDSNQLTLSIR